MTMPIKRFIRQKRQSCASVSEGRKQNTKTESDCPSKTNILNGVILNIKNTSSAEELEEMERQTLELLAKLDNGGD